MANTSTIRIVALAMLLACAGCGAVVEISHNYPSDVPMPADARIVHLGDFTARWEPHGNIVQTSGKVSIGEIVSTTEPTSGFGTAPDGIKLVMPEIPNLPNYNVAQFTAKALADELAATDYFVVQRTTSGPAVGDIEITGTIHVTVKDDSSTRKIRMAPTGNELREVPTLTRRVNVRIDFELTDLRSDKPIGVVQTGMDYLSTEDPATRGPNGLLRADDPKNVPPADEIIRKLVPHCVKSLVSMILPAEQTVSVALKPTSNEFGQRAISLARHKQYTAALTPAAIAVGMESSNALIFNLAVLSEATGHYDDALRYYRDAWDISSRQDMQARQGLRRMERLALMANAATPMPASGPASTAPSEAPDSCPDDPINDTPSSQPANDLFPLSMLE